MIGLLAISVVVPVPALLEVVSVPMLLIVRAPVLVILTLPDVELLKARFVTAVSNASPLPMPVVADSASDVAVMIVAEALASLIEPVAASSTVVPVLEPAKSMLESSAMETVVPENVRLPKFVSFPALSPNVIVVVAVSVAKPVTPMSPAVPSEIVPVVLSVSDPAVLDPANTVSEPSVMLTAPPDVTVSEPKFELLPTSFPSAMVEPEKLALPVMARSPSAPSVTVPVAVTVRLAAVTEPSRASAPAAFVRLTEVEAETVPVVRSPPPDWSNVTEPAPVVRLATETAVASALSRLIAPVVVSALIDVAANSSAIELPIPVAAFRSIVVAVMTPAPLIEPALVIVTVSASVVVVPIRITLPPPVVVNTTSPSVAAETLVAIVRSPPALDSAMLFSPAVGEASAAVETVPKLTPPAPKFSNRIVPPPAVVSVVTVTAPASALSMFTLPDVLLSAVIVDPASSNAVVFPIPVAALRSIVAAVTSPAPLIAPAVVIVTASSAVVVPSSVTEPEVTPVVMVMSAVLPTLSTARLPVFARMIDPLPSRPAETVMRFVATTAALIVMSSSASSVTVVGSIAASTVIPSAASSRIVPDPVSLALMSMLPVPDAVPVLSERFCVAVVVLLRTIEPAVV